MYLYSSFFRKDLALKLKSGKLDEEGGIKLFNNPLDAYKMRVSQGNVPDRMYKSGIVVIELDTEHINLRVDKCADRIKGVLGLTRNEIEPRLCNIVTYRGGRGSKLESRKSIRRFK